MKPKRTRFSDHFRLGSNQAQLDFVDIPIETDIPLFIDPYALHISSQDWLRECGNTIVSYFELLIDSIRSRDTKLILQLLDNFHEPNETHLGLSSGRPAGRGWGLTQSKQLLAALENSAAVASGKLSDLGDYEMFIPGVGPDKISDLATNIIKNELLTYTQEQCFLFDIPIQSVAVGRCWQPASASFISEYVDLPVCPSGAIILVPKTAVRTHLIPSRDNFYSKFILDYLEAELISANDSLVTVLKSGHRRVFRKELRQRYPYTPDQIFKFSKDHPEILKMYKDSLPPESKPLSNREIELKQQERRNVDVSNLGEQLGSIRPGREGANAFHNAVLGILSAIFYPLLTRPTKEQVVNEGRKRIDINFTNAAEQGFFSHLVNAHKFHAPYIAVECKNYREDPENPEFDQLVGRFSRTRGNVGLLICRDIVNRVLITKRCKDILNSRSELSLVLVLDDVDLVKLLRLRVATGDAGVNQYMQTKLDEVLFQ